MSTRHLVALGGLLAAGALGACSSATPTPITKTVTQQVTPTVTPTATTASTTTSASPTTTTTTTAAPAAGTLALGATYSTSGYTGTTPVTYTVQQWRDTATSTARQAQAGTHYGSLLAGFCNYTKGATSVSWRLWSVQSADGQNFPAATTQYSDDPIPSYPFEQVVSPGQCVKGWIVFAVANGVKVSTATVGNSDTVPPARWSIG